MLHSGEKMSKSLGNLVFAKDLLKHYSGATIRLALFNYHHRIGGEWNDELLDEAQELEARLKHALTMKGGAVPGLYMEQLHEALDDDLNTHDVLHVLRNFSDTILSGGCGNHPEAIKGLQDMLDLLGLDIKA
jgi:cysteinyl-tRNA synthetase